MAYMEMYLGPEALERAVHTEGLSDMIARYPPHYLNTGIIKLNRWDTFRKVFPSPFLNSFNLVKSKTTLNEYYRDK